MPTNLCWTVDKLGMKREFTIAALAVYAAFLLAAGQSRSPANDPFDLERMKMVRSQIELRGIKDPAVLKAMRTVPRHELVPKELRDHAYRDHPLPIGHGQTISQPYIVALMTELLELQPDDKVLEVGTGSGYQAAVLAEIAREVVTCEILEPLATRARRDLLRLGYDNILVHHSDGYWGYAEGAPYDAIIVTAAPGYIPPPLLEQLKPGGSMVIPVGPSGETQKLLVVKKDADGKTITRDVAPVRFVPFTRDKGEQP